jgi:hypothetical protein
MAGPFATATELAEWTGMALPPDLSRLQALLNSASAIIRAHCYQTLSVVVDDQVTVYPTPSTFLSLPERPVTSVAGVLVDGAPFTAYYVSPRGLRSGSLASPGTAWTRGATVTYTHGYPEGSEAFETFRSITIEMAKRAYTADENGQALFQGGVSAETVGFPTSLFLTPANKDALRPYIRGPVR